MAKIHCEISQANFEFDIIVEDFETKQEICSSEIVLSSIPWQIRVEKKEASLNNFVLDLSLNSLSIETLSCEAFAIFKLLAIETNEILMAKKLPKQEFNEIFQSNTLNGFISWNDLIDPNKKFITQGKIRFDIEIFANPVKSFISNEIKCSRSTFKIVIEDVNKIECLSSPKIVIRDLEWWIELRKADDLIGIFLCCDHKRIPTNWYYDVDAKFKMLAANDGTVLKEAQFKKDYRVGLYDWGFKNFFPFEDFVKAANAAIWLNHVYFEAEIIVDAAKPLWNFEEGLQSLIGASISKCPVCLESFNKCQVSSTKCGHLFCTPCITRVIRQHKRCSICNAAAGVEDLRSVFIS